MSIAAIGGLLGRAAGPAALGGVSRLLGRRGRKRARAAAARAAVQPGIVSRAVSLAQRVTGAGVIGRISPVTGMPMRRRRRGITAAEIRGFKKLSRLLSQFGMRPRGLARPMARGRRPFSRARFGDPEGGDLGDE